MELAKTLLRSTMRAFYETKYILVVDALCIHNTLRDDDLAYLMSMNTKDLHKLCGTLELARCITRHIRPEIREGQQRPINRTYYYIDFRQSIDAIKWRVHKIDKDMQGKTVPASERKEYFCARCKAEWTQMEVLDHVSEAGFLCHRCSYPLTHDAERQSGGHKESTRMNQQFAFITELLREIDSLIVPESTFEHAFANRVIVERDSANQVQSSVGADDINRPTAVKGLSNTGPTTIELTISGADGPSEAEIAAERARKEKLIKQNALPSWIAKSTVSGDAFRAEAAATIKQENTNAKADGPKDDGNDEALDDYFAKLKKQTEEEEKRRAAQQAEESSDEEDEEFEDVVSTPDPGTSARATPALGVASTAPVVPSPLRQSSLKREGPSGGNSPSGTPGSDGRPPKKVKVEEPAPPAPANDDDDDSEDDVEFEDV